MIGKGLIALEPLGSGYVEPSEEGSSIFSEHMLPLISETERPIIDFLCLHFAKMAGQDIAELRRRTGLRRLANE
jgi:hypothetical protein